MSAQLLSANSSTDWGTKFSFRFFQYSFWISRQSSYSINLVFDSVSPSADEPVHPDRASTRGRRANGKNFILIIYLVFGERKSIKTGGVADVPKKTYPFRVESFISENPVAYIIPFLAVIVVLLYRLNANTTTYNKTSSTTITPKRNCRTCNARVSINATFCPVCDDEP